MKISSFTKLAAGILAVPCLAVALNAQTIYLDDDFEGYFDTDALQWDWPRTNPDATSLSELATVDPDGTTVNNSLRSQGGSRWTHPDASRYFGELTPTNEVPIVFSFRFYDPMTMSEPTDESDPVLLGGNEFATIRPSAAANFIAVGLTTFTDDGAWDVNGYQARFLGGGGGNWRQLATPRSPGWREFEIVIHHDTVDVYVDGVLDANATAVPRNPGAVIDRVTLGSGIASNVEVRYDDVVVKQDSAFARTFQIDTHPVSQEVAYGSDIVLSVEVSGTGPFNYQWELDGMDLADGNGVSGSTSDILTISSADFDDTGLYRVRVSDPATTQSSSGAQVTVEPFLFDQQPETVVIITGEDATFNVEVSGIGPFTYQWLMDDVEMSDGGVFSGTNTDTLTITGASMADSAGYSVEVTNEFGTRVSDIARLSVGPAPTGVRWGDFEDIPSVPTTAASVLFRNPSFSGSSSPHLNTTLPSPNNTTIITDDFPEGMWGARTLRAVWSWLPDRQNPWLRLTTFGTTQILPNPIISFEQYLRFDIYTNEDVYVALSVRDKEVTGEFGSDGVGSGALLKFVGGTTDNVREGVPTEHAADVVPPLGRLVKAGQWTTLYFNMPEEPIKAFLNGDPFVNPSGVLDALVFVPYFDGEGDYSTDPFEVYLDNFEVTEVGPPDVVELPETVIMRGEGDAIVIELVGGEPNTTYNVLVSENLVDWDPAGTVETDGNGDGVFTDANGAANNRRFYRVTAP